MPAKRILFFWNGNTAVFDENDRQVPELQVPWIVVFARWLEARGIEAGECEFTLPNGSMAVMFRTSTGDWNWRVEHRLP